jgi:hypothetical protein
MRDPALKAFDPTSHSHPYDVISQAIEVVCSDGNSDPRVVAIDIVAALERAGWEITRKRDDRVL